MPAALTTGASGGIGLDLARIFAREGYGLVLVARGGVCAEAGDRGVMSGKSVVIPGVMKKLLEQSVRFSPRSIVTKIARKMQEESWLVR